MKNKFVWIVLGLVAVVGAWAMFFRNTEEEADIEYRYAAVEEGELLRSISATGQMVALTTVDVKSKAGGNVVQLAVDEGDYVQAGQLIARIDPSDTRAVFDQAQADVRQARARADQARDTYKLQVAESDNSVKLAQAALEQARIRLARSELEAKRQPSLTTSNMRSAEAAVEAAKAEVDRLESVTIPQQQREVQTGVSRTRVEYETAQTELERQRRLLEKGYVAQADVDRARSTAEAARAAFEMSQQRARTLERDFEAQRKAARTNLDRAVASLQEAQANRSQNNIAEQNLKEARNAVAQAQLDLQRAKDNQINNSIRRSDIQAADASAVRSRVSWENARVQLDSTTVTAPRSGVVTLKYLEEGTIIPPGMSTFAQGTSIVQISDTTRMFVECAVDEVDIGAVREGQQVRIVTEAFPGERLQGVVRRVNPAAATESNITAIKVRVEILPGYKVRLLPGMNATCEFITMSKSDILVIPQQAVKRDGDKTYVMIKSADPLKPVRREVKLGESGNEGVEILEGVKPGEEVVVAEINLAEMRETQQRMLEAQEGGGLAGGMRPGGQRRPAGGGGGGGGARPGGGGR